MIIIDRPRSNLATVINEAKNRRNGNMKAHRCNVVHKNTVVLKEHMNL